MSERGERALGEIVGGKYRICRFLAAGGMGSVYEAQHTLVKRRFAVKFLHPDLARKRDLLARFQREAEAAGALESENVAASVDLGITADGAPYIVMEYLVGESLELLLEREGTLPVERAAELVQQASRGIQAAHARGIVHRDLKPHNLFVCRREDGTDLLKVLDFGVAKLEVLEQNSAATRTGTVLGTPSYMSPEQARGEKNVGHAADVYALGAILYELVSGKRPHPGESHNAILHHISTQSAVPLASVRPGLPEGLLALVEQALAGHPEDRPASAEAFGLALAPWAERKRWPKAELDGSVPARVGLAPHGEPSTTELAPANFGADRPSPEPSLPVAALDRARESAASARPPWLFVALGAAAVLLSIAVFSALERPPRAAPPSAPIQAMPDPLTSSAASEARVTAVPTPPVTEVALPESRFLPVAQAANTAPSSARPSRSPPEPHAPPAPRKLAAPLEAAAAPVTFDQKNPYR